MAEGFEQYHVPQQSRRDKLRDRVVAQNNSQFALLYDPSSSPSSDLLSVKEELGPNLMAFPPSSSSSTYPLYLDPQSSNLPLNLNPNSIHDINSNFFLYTPQNLRDFDPSNYNEVVPFKPEPLSLSLSNNSNSHHQSNNNLPLELNLQRFGDSGGGGGYGVSGENGLARSAVPLGPFTGYASILKGSRFLKPAQQLLEEFCDVGRAIYSDKTSMAMDSSLFDDPNYSVDCLNDDDPLNCTTETRRKKSRLISMLDEVYRRYRYYYQQMQAVVASFECVAGLGNAAPFANLALKTMSKHFRSLKNAITDQLQFTNKGHGQMSHRKEEATRLGNFERGLYVQRSVQNSGFSDNQPVWRPQRGLPERAVTVLKAWLFEHFLHPYPTDTDKLMLAKQTGLSRSQVSNWFINARVRLWKPMVEEIHMLETRQAQKGSQRQEQNAIRSSNLIPVSNTENPSTSTKRFQDTPSKRTRSELPDLPSGNEKPLHLSYNGTMSTHPPVGVSMSKAGRSSGVSLTLGLHQNNGMGVSEPFPMNAAQRFGLGLETSEGLVMGGFEAHNRHFGRDVIEGQLLHDFVG